MFGAAWGHEWLLQSICWLMALDAPIKDRWVQWPSNEPSIGCSTTWLMARLRLPTWPPSERVSGSLVLRRWAWEWPCPDSLDEVAYCDEANATVKFVKWNELRGYDISLSGRALFAIIARFISWRISQNLTIFFLKLCSYVPGAVPGFICWLCLGIRQGFKGRPGGYLFTSFISDFGCIQQTMHLKNQWFPKSGIDCFYYELLIISHSDFPNGLWSRVKWFCYKIWIKENEHGEEIIMGGRCMMYDGICCLLLIIILSQVKIIGKGDF